MKRYLFIISMLGMMLLPFSACDGILEGIYDSPAASDSNEFEMCIRDRDRKFGEKLQTILEKQLDNPEFTIEDFASAVGVSRAAFFRKVKGVTGYTPNEYMRILRMKRAMELLQEGIYNVRCV